LGNYALWIAEFSKNNVISNSSIKDIGGGGIIVGLNVPGAKRLISPPTKSPSFNVVSNCKISNCGVIFPSGVGIAVMQANHTIIKSNTIYDLPYTGISIGWTYTFEDNYTNNNIIEDNYIYDVMKVLADGAGIYTLGNQSGSVYRNNFIKNIYRSKIAVGSLNNGFFFDEGSSGFLVDSNVVINVRSQDYRFHKTDTSKITLGNNYFEKSGKNIDLLRLRKLRVTE